MTKNTLNAIVAIALGLLFLIMTVRLPVMNIGDSVGPKVFPTIVAVALIVLGIILLVTEILNKSKVKEKISLDIKGQKSIYIKIALTMAAGLIYGLLLDPLGYLISTTLFMLVVTFLINSPKRYKQNILISLAFAVVTYGAFAMLLELSLPRGILPF